MGHLTIHSPEVLEVVKEMNMQPLQALRHVQQRKKLQSRGRALPLSRSTLLMTPVKGDIP